MDDERPALRAVFFGILGKPARGEPLRVRSPPRMWIREVSGCSPPAGGCHWSVRKFGPQSDSVPNDPHHIAPYQLKAVTIHSTSILDIRGKLGLTLYFSIEMLSHYRREQNHNLLGIKLRRMLK